jgi:hypothetical protein
MLQSVAGSKELICRTYFLFATKRFGRKIELTFFTLAQLGDYGEVF